jgi:methylated-DNA-protein-cysteine methyltransferase-like protein
MPVAVTRSTAAHAVVLRATFGAMSPTSRSGAGSYARIYAVVRRIPRGRVATYGQVAELAGLPGHARQVGYALHALRWESGVPWHRVINAAGAVSRRAVPGAELTQRQLLEREGVVFDGRGRVPLAKLRWQPRGRR